MACTGTLLAACGMKRSSVPRPGLALRSHVHLEPRPFARALFGHLWRGRLVTSDGGSATQDRPFPSGTQARGSPEGPASVASGGGPDAAPGATSHDEGGVVVQVPDVAVKVFDPRLALRHVTRVHGPEVSVPEDADSELYVLNLARRHPHPNLQAMHPVFSACASAGAVAARATEAGRASGKLLVAITPWCDGGDLWTLVINATTRQKRLPLDHVRTYAKQAASGLAHLHSLGWAHLDVSAENIFLSRNTGGHAAPWTAVVADFGMARQSETKHGYMYVRMGGKEVYQAPEVWDAGVGAFVRGANADVYSLGVVLFMMLAGQHPYSRVGDEFHAYTREGRLADQVQAWGLTERFASGALDLVQRMMNMNPRERPTMEEVLLHPWFTAEGVEGADGNTARARADEPAAPEPEAASPALNATGGSSKHPDDNLTVDPEATQLSPSGQSPVATRPAHADAPHA